MNRDRHPRRRAAARNPLSPLGSVGRGTTGWRSSLMTNPRESLGNFVATTLIAAGAFVLIVVVIVWLGS
jgi:hypothetical protein